MPLISALVAGKDLEDARERNARLNRSTDKNDPCFVRSEVYYAELWNTCGGCFSTIPGWKSSKGCLFNRICDLG